MPPGPSDSPADIEVAQDLAFERRSWTVQRAAWMVGVLVIAAAIAGVFGHGPVSSATVSSADGTLRVEYERVLRDQSPFNLRVHITPQPGGSAVIWLAREYFEKARLRHVTPDPERAEVHADGTLFTFAAAGDDPVEVVFHFDMDGLGSQPLRIAGGAGASEGPGAVSAAQFILP